MLLAMASKLLAQNNNGIEVNHFPMNQTELHNENHQFEIVQVSEK